MYLARYIPAAQVRAAQVSPDEPRLTDAGAARRGRRLAAAAPCARGLPYIWTRGRVSFGDVHTQCFDVSFCLYTWDSEGFLIDGACELDTGLVKRLYAHMQRAVCAVGSEVYDGTSENMGVDFSDIQSGEEILLFRANESEALRYLFVYFRYLQFCLNVYTWLVFIVQESTFVWYFKRLRIACGIVHALQNFNIIFLLLFGFSAQCI